MSEMSDFFKRIAENNQNATSEERSNGFEEDEAVSPGTPLEQAIEKAIYSLKEIKYYAELGRANGCLAEANDALNMIEILMDQHQNMPSVIEPDVSDQEAINE